MCFKFTNLVVLVSFLISSLSSPSTYAGDKLAVPTQLGDLSVSAPELYDASVVLKALLEQGLLTNDDIRDAEGDLTRLLKARLYRRAERDVAFGVFSDRDNPGAKAFYVVTWPAGKQDRFYIHRYYEEGITPDPLFKVINRFLKSEDILTMDTVVKDKIYRHQVFEVPNAIAPFIVDLVRGLPGQYDTPEQIWLKELMKGLVQPVDDLEVLWPISDWEGVFTRIAENVEFTDDFTIALDRGKNGYETFRIRIPKISSFTIGSREEEIVTRFLSVYIFNRLLSLGGERVLLDGDIHLIALVKQKFDQLFNSTPGKTVSGYLGMINGKPFGIARMGVGEKAGIETIKKPEVIKFNPQKGRLVGVDLGGTSIKVVVIVDGEVTKRESYPWNPQGITDPQEHIKYVRDAVRNASSGLDGIDAVGISWAGVTKEGRIVGSGPIVQGLSREQFDGVITKMTDTLTGELGVPVRAFNDGQSGGFGATVVLGLNNTLCLGLGTGLASCYIDETGSIADILGEVGNVIINMDPNASGHSFTGVAGVLQQNLSQHAVVRLAERLGIDLSSFSRQEKARGVNELLGRGDERARRVYERVARHLALALIELRQFLKFEHVVIFGGVTSPTAGDFIRDTAVRILGGWDIQLSPERQYGGAIGAAQLSNKMLQEEDAGKALLPFVPIADIYPGYDASDMENTEEAEIVFDRGASGIETFKLRVPKRDVLKNHEVVGRYLSIYIYNRLVTFGAERVLIKTYQELGDIIAAEFNRSFNAKPGKDIRGYLTMLNGKPFELIVIGKYDVVPITEVPVTPPITREFDPRKGTVIGVDLGGTAIKIAVVKDGKVIDGSAKVISWEPGKIKDPREHIRIIEDAIRSSISEYGLTEVNGIGISWAGAVKNNQVVGTGPIVSGLSRDDFNNVIKRLADIISSDFGNIPVVVANDGEAGGFRAAVDIKMEQGVEPKNTLCFIMGTGLASCYLDSNGNMADILHEMGNVIIDLSPDAAPHTWTGVKGVLQRYLSQHGIVRLAEASDIDLSGLPQEDKAKYVGKDLLDRDDPAAIKVHEELGRHIATAVAELAKYLAIEQVVISGGITLGRSGEIFRSSAEKVLAEKYPDLKVRINVSSGDRTAVRFGGAIGAAYLANQTAQGLKRMSSAYRRLAASLSAKETQAGNLDEVYADLRTQGASSEILDNLKAGWSNAMAILRGIYGHEGLDDFNPKLQIKRGMDRAARITQEGVITLDYDTLASPVTVTAGLLEEFEHLLHPPNTVEEHAFNEFRADLEQVFYFFSLSIEDQAEYLNTYWGGIALASDYKDLYVLLIRLYSDRRLFEKLKKELSDRFHWDNKNIEVLDRIFQQRAKREDYLSLIREFYRYRAETVQDPQVQDYIRRVDLDRLVSLLINFYSGKDPRFNKNFNTIRDTFFEGDNFQTILHLVAEAVETGRPLLQVVSGIVRDDYEAVKKPDRYVPRMPRAPPVDFLYIGGGGRGITTLARAFVSAYSDLPYTVRQGLRDILFGSVVTTFDDGGHTGILLTELYNSIDWGRVYIIPPGDIVPILNWLTGDQLKTYFYEIRFSAQIDINTADLKTLEFILDEDTARRIVDYREAEKGRLRTEKAFNTPEDLKKLYKDGVISMGRYYLIKNSFLKDSKTLYEGEPITSLEELLRQKIREAYSSHREKPMDWWFYASNILNVARLLDRELVMVEHPVIKLNNVSWQNLFYMGMLVDCGVLKKREDGATKAAVDPTREIGKILDVLGIAGGYSAPVSFGEGTLSVVLQAGMLRIGHSMIYLKRDSNGRIVIGDVSPMYKVYSEILGKAGLLDSDSRPREDLRDTTKALLEEIIAVHFEEIPYDDRVIEMGGHKVTFKNGNDKEIIITVDGKEELIVSESTSEEGKTIYRRPDSSEWQVVNADTRWTDIRGTNGLEIGLRSRLVEEQTFITDEVLYSPVERLLFKEAIRNEDGSYDYVMDGDGRILPDKSGTRRMRRFKNISQPPAPNPEVIDMIRNARRAIIMGEGSTVTSLLPNLITPEILLEVMKRQDIPRIFFPKIYEDLETAGLDFMAQVEMIERSVQQAAGNPNIRFEDIFSHVVIPRISDKIKKRFYEGLKGTAEDLDSEKTSLSIKTRETKPSKLVLLDILPDFRDNEKTDTLKKWLRGRGIEAVETNAIILSKKNKLSYNRRRLVRLFQDIAQDYMRGFMPVTNWNRIYSGVIKGEQDTEEVGITFMKDNKPVREFNLQIPEGSQDSPVVRYLATYIYNRLVAIGAEQILLKMDPGLYEKVISEFNGLFNIEPNEGITDFMTMIYNRPFQFRPVGESEPPTVTAPITSPYERKPLDYKRGNYIGIEIGKDSIKTIVIRDGEIDRDSKEILRWNPEGIFSVTRYTDILIRQIVKAQGRLETIDGIGISWQGVVLNNKIVDRGPVVKGLTEEDFRRVITNLADEVSRRFSGVPVAIVNDGYAEGLRLAQGFGWDNVKEALVMSLGGGLASTYFNKEGQTPDILTELGKLVIDLSPEAAAHGRTRVRGALQSYLSGRGLERVAEEHQDIDFSDIPSGRATYIRGLLEKGDLSAEEAYKELGLYLATAIMEITQYLPLKKVIITGGITIGEAGKLIKETAEEILTRVVPDLQVEIILGAKDELEATHGGALGAVYEAVSLAEDRKVKASHITRTKGEGEEKALYELDIDSKGRLKDGAGLDRGKTEMLQGALSKLKSIYGVGIFRISRKLKILDNLDGLRLGDNREGPLAHYADGIIRVDIDAFRDEGLLFDVLEHELIESILSLIEPNNGIAEVTAVYRNIRRFFESNTGYQEGILNILKAEDNGLDPSGDYARLLEYIRSKELTEEGIISAVVRYVLSTERYGHLAGELGIDIGLWPEVVRHTEDRLEAALDVYTQLKGAEKPKITHKVKRTENALLRRIKTYNGHIRIEGLDKFPSQIGRAVDVLVENSEYKIQGSSLIDKSRMRYIVLNRNNAVTKNQNFIDSIRELESYKTEDGSTQLFKVVFEMPDGIDTKDVIRLVDPADLSKIEKREDSLYLPMPYMRASLFLAAEVVLTGGDAARLSQNARGIIAELYRQLVNREVTDGDLINLFTRPWIILPEISSIIGDLDKLQLSAHLIEQAA